MFYATDEKVGDIMPLVIFVAMEQHTKMRVIGKEISIPVGSMLVTSQDFWHGGAAYKDDHFRLFFKVNYNGGVDKTLRSGGLNGSLGQNDQFFIPDDWTEKPLEWVETERAKRK